MFSDFDDNDDLLAVPTPAAAPDTTAGTGDDWMSSAWGGTKKSKQGKKTGIEDLSASVDLTTTISNKSDPSTLDGTAAKGKKAKGGKKGAIVEEEPPPPPPAPEAPAEADDLWSSFSKKSTTTKGKKGKFASPEPSIPEFEPEPEPEPEPSKDLYADTTGWDSLSLKDRKKEREGGQEKGLAVTWRRTPASRSSSSAGARARARGQGGKRMGLWRLGHIDEGQK